MINLYNTDNTNFTNNGNVVLAPIRCELSATLNGAWELTLEHAIDKEEKWKSIVETAVLRVPSFNGEQLFRIRQITISDASVVAIAEPIFFDAMNDVFLTDTRIVNNTAQVALNTILNGTKYSGTSNIAKNATAYYVMKNALEAITNEENGIIYRWGGEVLFDNFKIIINQRIGKDNGVQISYGKNIKTNGVNETINIDNLCTRIYPQAFNGRLLGTQSGWSGAQYVDSPLINSYPIAYIKNITYENICLKSDIEDETDTDGKDIYDTFEELYEALIEASEQEFRQGIDKPTVSIECEMALLSQTKEYAEYKDLENVSLGDTVHLKHSRLGIESTARIVALTYDCVRKGVTNVTIGAVEANIMNRIASSVVATEKALTASGQVKAQQIEGIIDGANARVVAQATSVDAQIQKVILFEDLNPASSTFGAMALGTTGFVISNTRNADDTDWIWTTFGTGAGFSADLIRAGTLTAINIIGSVITGGTISGTTLTGSEISGTEINGSTIKGGTITGSTITQLHGTDKAVELDNRLLQFYNWATGQELVGAIGTVEGTYAGLFNIFFQKGGRIMINSSKTDTIDLSSYDNFDKIIEINGGTTNPFFNMQGSIYAKNGFRTEAGLGVTRTVTIGGVTLTIKGGIITNVS